MKNNLMYAGKIYKYLDKDYNKDIILYYKI